MVGWIEVSFPLAQCAMWVCVVFWLALGVALYLGKSRTTIGKLYIWSSVVTGLHLWMLSFIVTYRTLGVVWLFVGLLAAGVGVIPLAWIGDAVRGLWWEMPQLMIALALAFAPRMFGTFLLEDSK